MKGITTEQWVREVVVPPPKPKAPPKMKRPKLVTRKKKEEKDFSFDDMDEDYGNDLSNLGIDIPAGGEW